ncbi:MAG: glycosyltransferase family 4 protein [Candidatus Omnitrophica bacterium]|nr:glycosyltransferase family 4 protein [Candidatus Omnitrophota bacterium]
MKILMINKYHHITGGADTYYFQLNKLLRTKGHEVIEFCLNHPRNLSSEYSEYFIAGVTHENWKEASAIEKVKAYINAIYNLEAKRKIGLLIEKTKPDIAHIHNIFYQISPSILEPLKKASIPIIQTLHDYQAICASNNLCIRNQVCEMCKGGRYYNILKKRCYSNSLAASFLAFSAKVVHSTFKIYHQKIDIFISPTQFLKDKFVSCGIDESKVVIIPHAIDLSEYKPSYNLGDYVVFAGRFVRQKGILTLIKAFESLPIKLVLLGTGELLPEIEDYIDNHNLKNIKLSGFLRGKEFQEIIKDARFVIVPSEWYENSPLIIHESFACGKPVVASNIGGIPELVTEDVGLLFTPGDVEDLRKKVMALYYGDELIKFLGRNARKKVEDLYNPEVHYERIIKLYSDLIS